MSEHGALNEVDAFGPGFIEISDRLGRYDTTEEDAAAVVALLGLQPGARVLDAGCGFGRFAAALAALGCDVVGVDISRAVIAEAQRRCPGPRYVVADLTKPLHGVEPVDAIVSVFSSFGYGATVEDDAAMLRTLHAALRPGGRLVMELSDLERARHRLGPPGRVVHRTTNGVAEQLVVNEANVLHVRYELDGYVEHVETRLFDADALARMLVEAGFQEPERFGGFDGRPKTPDDRLVLVARA